mmetsp:Transcript_37468/g.84562  ORF Transcript_37468/g.84562 Transcript_37468/m.84562 type:complete len:186 (-) Transcript_37468:50-607(-)
MGCGCVKAQAAGDPQEKRDRELALRLQQEEDQRARAAGGSGGGGRSGGSGRSGGGGGGGGGGSRQPQPGWNTAGAGHTLGSSGVAAGSDGGGGDASLSPEERRQRALEAAEKRQVTVPGLSQKKAQELNDKRQKDDLLGKLAEHYNRKKMEMPMGLNAATTEQLRAHWEHVRQGESTADQVLQAQ